MQSHMLAQNRHSIGVGAVPQDGMATSPGMIHIIKKISHDTPISVATARSMRRVMYCCMTGLRLYRLCGNSGKSSQT